MKCSQVSGPKDLARREKQQKVLIKLLFSTILLGMIENTKSIISEAPPVRAEQVRNLLDGLELSDGRLTIGELERIVFAIASKPMLFEDLIVDDETNR
jgi:hypothetical protein